MATISSIKAKIQGLIDKSNEATGGSDTDLTTAIDNLIANQGGGGDPTDGIERAVNFYDYDGTLLYSYTIEDAQKLSVLPNLPSRDRLVCDGWTHTLEDVKATTHLLNIGAMYHTQSGATEIDIELTKVTGLSVSFISSLTSNGLTSIDWGDGTTNSTLTHTYTNYGKYTIKLYGVTKIEGNKSSSYNITGTGTSVKYIKKVFLSKDVTTIDNQAFRRLYTLKEITLSNSITSIGYFVFHDLYGINAIILPNSVLSLGSNSFYNVKAKTLVIPNSVTSIGDSCFNNTAIESLVIPNSVTSIGKGAFQNINPLKKVVILDGVKNISDSMFSSCYGLEEVIIPNSVNDIAINGFCYCQNLKNIIIPPLTTLNSQVFYYCLKLKHIKIPKFVTSISDYAFYACHSVEEFDFSQHTSVPTLSNKNAFTTYGDYKILVPSALYDEWIVATNWSDIANAIYAV